MGRRDGFGIPGLRVVLALALVAGCARGAPVDDTGVPPDTADVPVGDGADDTGDDAPPPDALRECAQSSDCARAAGGPVCDVGRGVCVACTATEDPCPSGTWCSANRCVTGCRTEMDCPGTMVRCDPATHTCVGCLTDDNCPPSTVCRSSSCVPGCTDAHPCGIGSTCCAGSCVNLQTERSHCGACGMACPGDQACCAGTCAQTLTDPRNCGTCGVTCTTAHGTPGCAVGTCSTATCEAGWGDCDGSAASGCEVDTATSPLHCGRCGNACPSGINSTARCLAGTCALECAEGHADCNHDPADGCEVALATTPAHCGACDRPCVVGANAMATCALGVCGLTCSPGFGNCDGMAANGCEVDTDGTPANCGSCGLVCSHPHATAGCAAGRCTLGTCEAGWADCNHDVADGCETGTTSNNANCGACGTVCAAGTTCSGGTCTSVCAPPTTYCAGACVDLADDPAHCGSCTTACPTPPHATRTCGSRACGYACDRGWGDCNGASGDGCEVDLNGTPTSCGLCGRLCSSVNGTPTCAGGSCGIVCHPGFADCNGTPADGCEINLQSNPASCGACGSVCALPNATAGCAGGACTVAACASGYGNCNGTAGDGCEINLQNHAGNCGVCGRVCGPGTACSLGVCSSVCASPTVWCATPAPGRCANLQTDSSNCGSCGNVCAAGTTCTAGVCRAPAPPNDLCAGATVISLATPAVSLATTTVGATTNMTSIPCGSAGPDVFFRFTLTQREVVFADTYGTSWDTVLYFMSSCTTALIRTAAPGELLCDDDSGGAGCTSGGLQSQVAAILPAGTYYLALAAYGGGGGGTATIHFQHLPVGAGSVTLLSAGASTPGGTTAGTNGATPSCGYSSAPENAYWWRTCPEYAGGAFSATTCSRASWDTILNLANGSSAGNACNDDACGLQSTITATIGSGAGIHVLTVEGYSTNSGTYTVAVTRP